MGHQYKIKLLRLGKKKKDYNRMNFRKIQVIFGQTVMKHAFHMKARFDATFRNRSNHTHTHKHTHTHTQWKAKQKKAKENSNIKTWRN